jgi:predicted ATP-dependent serine protease
MICKHCGYEHSDWLSCDGARSWGATIEPLLTAKEVSTVLESAPEQTVKYDRAKAMREYHAKKRLQK